MECIELSTELQCATWFSPDATSQRGINQISLKQLQQPQPHRQIHINTLPDLMLLQILGFLPPSTLGIAAQVSRSEKKIVCLRKS